jgi:hypothetical protein
MVASVPCFHTVPATGLVIEKVAKEDWTRATRAMATESLYIAGQVIEMSGKRSKQKSWSEGGVLLNAQRVQNISEWTKIFPFLSTDIPRLTKSDTKQRVSGTHL